jgi:hypothetical protein
MSHALTCAVQPGRDRRLAHPERAGSFAIREAHQVDRDERVAEVVRKDENGGVYLCRLDTRFRPDCVSVLHELELIWKGFSSRSARSGSTSGQERVPKCPQQIADVIVCA